MGWGVGLAQRLAGRKWFGAGSSWMWTSTLGIAAPCLFADLVPLQENWLLLPALAAVGGLLSGLMQSNALRSRSPKARWWVAVSAAAWLCPALLVELVVVPGRPRNAVEFVRNFGSIALGGVVLGVLTGLALAVLLNSIEPDTHGN